MQPVLGYTAVFVLGLAIGFQVCSDTICDCERKTADFAQAVKNAGGKESFMEALRTSFADGPKGPTLPVPDVSAFIDTLVRADFRDDLIRVVTDNFSGTSQKIGRIGEYLQTLVHAGLEDDLIGIVRNYFSKAKQKVNSIVEIAPYLKVLVKLDLSMSLVIVLDEHCSGKFALDDSRKYVKMLLEADGNIKDKLIGMLRGDFTIGLISTKAKFAGELIKADMKDDLIAATHAPSMDAGKLTQFVEALRDGGLRGFISNVNSIGTVQAWLEKEGGGLSRSTSYKVHVGMRQNTSVEIAIRGTDSYRFNQTFHSGGVTSPIPAGANGVVDTIDVVLPPGSSTIQTMVFTFE